MYLRYGDYLHDSGELDDLQISRETQRAETGVVSTLIERWTMRGIKQANDVDDLTTKLQAMELAYSLQGQSAGLFQDNGTVTAHYLDTSRTIGGVRVVSIGYPVGLHEQYVDWRTWEIVLEAEYPDAGRGTIVSYVETISSMGGGPRFVMQQPLYGIPQKWQVASNTPYRAVQTGSAVTFRDYLQYPAPMWPQHEHTDRRVQSKITPELVNGEVRNYRTEWTYEFESISPLFGTPRLPR